MMILFRDNVYSIMAVFGLALAYRRVDDDQGRACKLVNFYCLLTLVTHVKSYLYHGLLILY
jgi:hypothetical protein